MHLVLWILDLGIDMKCMKCIDLDRYFMSYKMCLEGGELDVMMI
jgi:hypothetical protein